jgi:predicted DNA binding protein
MSAASTIAPARPLSMPRQRIKPTIVEPQTESKPRGDSSQCMQALARANEVRLARAALKRDVSAGRREVTEVILDSPWEADSMSLSELLCSQRRWGRARSRKLLSSIALNEAKRVGTLTDRQRRVLVAALEAKLARA